MQLYDNAMISFRITITSQSSQHLKECNGIKAELDQIPVYQLNKYRNVRVCYAHQYTPKTRSKSYYNPCQNSHMLIPKIYSKLIMILTIHYRQSYTKTHAMSTQHIKKNTMLT